MTHGWLTISDDHGSTFVLHVYHDGGEIPMVVDGAMKVLISHAKKMRWKSKVPAILASRASQHTDYAANAAALVIASEPCFLVPSTTEPSRGYANSFTMTVSEHKWMLTDGEGNLVLQFNPLDKLIKGLDG